MLAPVEFTTTLNKEPESVPEIVVPVPVNVKVGDAPDPALIVALGLRINAPAVTLYPAVNNVAGELTVMLPVAVTASVSVIEVFAVSPEMVLPADVKVVADVIDINVRFVIAVSPVPKTILDV